MNQRHLYALQTPDQLHRAMDALRRAGVADHQVSLVARHDIELALDPDAPDPDEHGRVRGLIAGLNAVAVPTLGVSIAGAGLLNYLGANMAAWIPALAGDHATDDVRARYSDLVEAGRILVVIEAPPETAGVANAALEVEGAEPLATPD